MCICRVGDGEGIEFLDDGVRGEVDGLGGRFHVGHVFHDDYGGVADRSRRGVRVKSRFAILLLLVLLALALL